MEIVKNRKFKNVVVLTGAGVSAESGIKTFRDANGLWEGHDITQVASFDAYQNDPAMVHRFYNARRKQLAEVKPNAAHRALAQLEKRVQNFSLITQNVDDLHERAGSHNIFHMHGELKKIRNTLTGEIKSFEGAILEKDFTNWRPDIVWFGEPVKYSEEIFTAASACDLFLCIGTSNNVYPAAGLVHTAKMNQAICVELNLEETQLSSYYDLNFFGPATEVVPEFLEQLTS